MHRRVCPGVCPGLPRVCPASAPVCPASAPHLPCVCPGLPRVCPVSAPFCPVSAPVCPVSAPVCPIRLQISVMCRRRMTVTLTNHRHCHQRLSAAIHFFSLCCTDSLAKVLRPWTGAILRTGMPYRSTDYRVLWFSRRSQFSQTSKTDDRLKLDQQLQSIDGLNLIFSWMHLVLFSK